MEVRMATKILLIRHGQTEWNRVERFRGHADVPLNETGLKQAEVTGRYVAANWKVDTICSSPLSRAVKTAEMIGKHVNLPVEIHSGLTDIDYGEWQGVTTEEAIKRWPAMVEAWYEAPHQVRIPGGETLEALRKRAMETIKDLTARHSGQTIVLVGHTVINKIILLGVLGLGSERLWHIEQDACAINVFEATARDYILISLNNTYHLSKLAST
jgi:probable phosphoglycerate mutase